MDESDKEPARAGFSSFLTKKDTKMKILENRLNDES